MSDAVKYIYDVKINAGAGFLQTKLLQDSFPSCGEMLIVSEEFSDGEDCRNNLTKFLAGLTAAESKLFDKAHVVVIKSNPMYNPDAKEVPEENWDHSIVMRAYVADAELLKQSILQYNIFAQIRSMEREHTFIQ